MNKPKNPPFQLQLLKSFDDMKYHPTSEQLVQILIEKTRNEIPLFFRVVVGYYWCKLAASMRVVIATPDNTEVPINMYALNLAPSGTGKGYSTGLLDNEITGRFKQRFMDETFPVLSERNLPLLAHKRANKRRTDPDEELVKLQNEFNGLGELLFDFSEATTPAVKQMRDKLLMAEAGAVNLEIDEIGSNLIGQTDVLTTFLELFDKGRVKKKLTKNSADNKRTEEIVGSTPTNLLMFGEPTRLLNGGIQEDQLYAMLQTGYARRCFFGYSRTPNKLNSLTVDQVYAQRTSQANSQFLENLADHLENLADAVNHGTKIVVKENVSKILIEYQLFCEDRADQLQEHEEIRKAEISHRYWKALKLAGAYAFIDGSAELTEEHLCYAIKLAEASGDAFSQLLSRDRPYVKLAKYLAAVGREVTHADMVEDLPYFKGSASARAEMLNLATAWGYKNNVIVEKNFESGIEFLRGKTLKLTDLSKLTVAWSQDITTGYTNDHAPWDKLDRLTQAQGLHWVNHHLRDGYRDDEHAMEGFDVLVIDVDGGRQLSTAKMLLEGRKALYYTTKRSTPTENRFRILLPMKYHLEMDGKDYTEFYKNVEQAIPFKVDPSCSYRTKKWLSHMGHAEYTDGELFDPLPFIPRTSKAEEQSKKVLEQQNLDNLERWVLNNTGDGNRNNMMLRYGMILVDAGLNAMQIQSKLLQLNEKLPKKLAEAEIQGSVMVTVAKKLAARGQVPGTAAQAAVSAAPQVGLLAHLGSVLTP
jgi:hypothetical protein